MKTLNRKPDYVPGTGISVEILNIKNIHPHCHEDVIEFIYCLKGQVELVSAHMREMLCKGDLITVDVNDVHSLYSNEDNMVLIIDVDLNNARIPIDHLRSTIFACATIIKNEIDIKAFEEICDKLLVAAYLKSQYQNNLHNNRDVSIYVEKLETIRLNIIDMMDYYFSWCRIEGLDINDKKYELRVRSIINYVQNNCLRKITLAEISSVVYLHPTYISNFMKKTSFKTFTHLVYYYRCLQAQKILLETDTPIGDIGIMCGFSSEKYFYRYFKKWWGYTPLQYKKMISAFYNEAEEYSDFGLSIEDEIIHYIAERQVSLAAAVHANIPQW